MAVVKPNLQKEINADLKRRGGLGFTELEFRNHPDAQKLQAIKEGTYVSTLNDSIEKAFEYNSFLDTVAKQRPRESLESFYKLIVNAVTASSTHDRDVFLREINANIKTLGLETNQIKEIIKECKAQPLPISVKFEIYLKNKLIDTLDVNAIQIKTSTAKALGLHHQSTINKLACDAYLFFGMTNPCHECGYEYEVNDLQRKINAWAGYCQVVKESKHFIKKTFPQWGKMRPKEKTDIINSWKALASIPFMQSSAHNFSFFIDFIENYQLNQGEETKAKALLALNIPNITSIEIAREVTKYSSLSK